jgi:hypothetical protein
VLVRLTGGDEVIPGDVAELIDSLRGDLVCGQRGHGTMLPVITVSRRAKAPVIAPEQCDEKAEDTQSMAGCARHLRGPGGHPRCRHPRAEGQVPPGSEVIQMPGRTCWARATCTI